MANLCFRSIQAQRSLKRRGGDLIADTDLILRQGDPARGIGGVNGFNDKVTDELPVAMNVEFHVFLHAVTCADIDQRQRHVRDAFDRLNRAFDRLGRVNQLRCAVLDLAGLPQCGKLLS